jgi:signal peptidase II
MVAALDQAVKFLVLDRLKPGVIVNVVDDLVALRFGMNRGLAFGLLGNLPEAWSWLPALLPLAALAALVPIARAVLATGGWSARLAIGLVFGGAVGNLIDRARVGAVVDFVDVYWREYHWPAFNVADASITVGVALLALRLATPSPHA